MKHRNPFLVILLTLFSCGIYFYIYLYMVAKELKLKTEANINPGVDVLIILIGCSPYLLYLPYRNQKLIDGWYQKRGLDHKPKANLVGFLSVMPIVGFLIAYVPFILAYSDAHTQLSGLITGLWGFAMISMYLLFFAWIYIFQTEFNMLAANDADEYSSIFQ